MTVLPRARVRVAGAAMAVVLLLSGCTAIAAGHGIAATDAAPTAGTSTEAAPSISVAGEQQAVTATSESAMTASPSTGETPSGAETDVLGPTVSELDPTTPDHADVPIPADNVATTRAQEPTAHADNSPEAAASAHTTSRQEPVPQPPPRKAHIITGQVLPLVNAQRSKRGLTPLAGLGCASAWALTHSKQQARDKTMDHASLGTIAAACDMPGGSNVAYGYATLPELFRGWWASEPHRANILNESYRYMGAAVAYASDGTPYYTQVFYIPD